MGHHLKNKKQQNGSTLLFVAISLALLMGFSALAVDVGYLLVTRNELQNTADAAALAGATELGIIYAEADEQNLTDFDIEPFKTRIQKAAKDVALKNSAAGEQIVIQDEDIRIAPWDWDINDLNPDLPGPATGVEVTARRDKNITPNGAVKTFFATIFSMFGADHATFNAAASATAALSGPTILDEGELKLPVGISQTVFNKTQDQYCNQEIVFYPTQESCVGWHNLVQNEGGGQYSDTFLGLISGYDDGKISGEKWLSDTFPWWDENTHPNPLTSPEITAYEDELYFSGGTIANLIANENSKAYVDWPETTYPTNYEADYNDMTAGTTINPKKEPAPWQALFDFYRFVDGDGDPEIWTTIAPIYDEAAGCDNPKGLILVTGYALIKIHGCSPQTNEIKATIDCSPLVISGLSGGSQNGNILGTIPNLVK